MLVEVNWVVSGVAVITGLYGFDGFLGGAKVLGMPQEFARH